MLKTCPFLSPLPTKNIQNERGHDRTWYYIKDRIESCKMCLRSKCWKMFLKIWRTKKDVRPPIVSNYNSMLDTYNHNSHQPIDNGYTYVPTQILHYTMKSCVMSIQYLCSWRLASTYYLYLTHEESADSDSCDYTIVYGNNYTINGNNYSIYDNNYTILR